MGRMGLIGQMGIPRSHRLIREIPIAAAQMTGYDQDMDEPLPQKSRAWWPIAVLAMLLTYPLSFGPACWMASRLPDDVSTRFVSAFYLPVIWLCRDSPTCVTTYLQNYANYGSRETIIVIMSDRVDFFWFHVGGLSSVRPFESRTSGCFTDDENAVAESKSDDGSP